jgi:hypothetical protein
VTTFYHEKLKEMTSSPLILTAHARPLPLSNTDVDNPPSSLEPKAAPAAPKKRKATDAATTEKSQHHHCRCCYRYRQSIA